MSLKEILPVSLILPPLTHTMLHTFTHPSTLVHYPHISPHLHTLHTQPPPLPWRWWCSQTWWTPSSVSRRPPHLPGSSHRGSLPGTCYSAPSSPPQTWGTRDGHRETHTYAVSALGPEPGSNWVRSRPHLLRVLINPDSIRIQRTHIRMWVEA